MACNSEKAENSNNKVVETVEVKDIQKRDKTEELLEKSHQFSEQKNYKKALDLINEAIKLSGESRNLLGYKYEVLMKMENFKEALETALQRDKIAERKSPWNCISIVEAYIKLNDKQKALEWLEKAVIERKFIYADYLDSENYTILNKEKKYRDLLKIIEKNIGIGKSVKDFSVTLLNKSQFTLSENRGKVILVVFWASWCPDCRAEIPHLLKLYNEYKDYEFYIIGINMDADENELKSFIEKQGIKWNNAFSGKKWYDDTAKLYNVSSIPSTWLVDKKGVLRYFNLKEEKLIESVKGLLKEE